MDDKNKAKGVDPKGKTPQGEKDKDNGGDGKRSKQGMIDRATEPEWYGVTSF